MLVNLVLVPSPLPAETTTGVQRHGIYIYTVFVLVVCRDISALYMV